MKVYPFNRINEDMGTSSQSGYLFRYLTELKAKTVIVESDYIDKDYLLDYSYYYSRSFEPIDRFTKRLHIFSETFSDIEFEKIFNSDEEFSKILKNSYLGFIVVKPIGDSKQSYEPFIGRSILKTYAEHDENEYRFFITNNYTVSLCGLPLNVDSLPYQTQDNMVSRCATTAIWASLHALNVLFDTQTYSPFEITQTSTSFPAYGDRNFPSTGLSIFQMKDYFNSIGLDTDFINVEKSPYIVRKQIVSDAVKAHHKLGLPIIACIRISKGTNKQFHAVVISGHRYDQDGNLIELYVHDDQIGPYSKVTPKNNGDFSYWENEWITEYGWEEIFVEGLFIPIYPKVRMSFNYLYETFLDAKNTDPNIELFLTELKTYKKYLLNKSFKNKINILTNAFPRFLWVVRNKNKKMDILIDAISLKLDRFCVIDYD